MPREHERPRTVAHQARRQRTTRGKGRPIVPNYLKGENPKRLIDVYEEQLLEETSIDEDGNIIKEALHASVNDETGVVTFRATVEKEVRDEEDHENAQG
jgi:hypothetical protein